MNNTYRTNFQNLRIPQLERIHLGVTHKKTVLQIKMAGDMERSAYYDILPRNYTILPIEKCSLHDIKKLEELHEKGFEVFWAMEKKKAEEKGTMEVYDATFKFYSFLDCLTDIEQKRLFEKIEMLLGHRVSTHMITRKLMEQPNFIDEVIRL